jgi:hypothetical protein
VKTVENFEVSISLKDGKTSMGANSRRDIISFKRDGGTIEHIVYAADGTVSSKTIYTYDQKGRNNGYEEYTIAPNKTLVMSRKTVYTYDERGRATGYKTIEANGTESNQCAYKYDARGNTIDESCNSGMGHFVSDMVRTYDNHDNMTSEIYSLNGVVSRKTSTKYQGIGYQMEIEQFSGNDLQSRMTITSTDGRATDYKTEYFDKTPVPASVLSTRVARTTTAYDDRANTMTIKSYRSDGTLINSQVYALDDLGQVTGMAGYDANGKPNDQQVQIISEGRVQGTLTGPTSQRTEVDRYGNWITITHTVKTADQSEPQVYLIQKRVFTYY